MKPFTLWFTGLSGAGKSTMAITVNEILLCRGIKSTFILDGDEIRKNLSKGLGFSRQDRDTNIERIGWICKILNETQTIAITAAISPYAETRFKVRQNIKTFIEVYVKCPIKILIERDTKGLYKKAISGNILNFTGISDPYEEPKNPEITIDTSVKSIDECAAEIIKALEKRGLI